MGNNHVVISMKLSKILFESKTMTIQQLMDTDVTGLTEDKYVDEYLQALFDKFPSAMSEAENYVPMDRVRVQYSVIDNKEEKEFWLGSKLRLEGDPTDEELIKTIGMDGEIKNPVIVDTRNDHTVEGRHRLAAGLRYGLEVPVLYIVNEPDIKPAQPESSTFQMYHGGQRWSLVPSELRASKQGRYESGIGINFTNNYETARKYAGGNRVVHLVDIDRNIVDLDSEKAKIDLDEMVEFLNGLRGLKKRKEIIADLQRYSDRVKTKTIPGSVLNNLVVNHEAGAGNVGLEIVRFFLSKGIDGVFTDKNGGEVWFVLFNLSKIKGVKVIVPKEFDYKDVMLPDPRTKGGAA